MALSIVKPFVHVEDANGNPYVGAKLYVYQAGTTTPLNIYSDSGLSVALANPLAGAYGSDAAGNFPRAYLAAGSYKLRAETSAGVLIWEIDNNDTGLSSGSGALPIASGGTGGTTAAAARTALGAAAESEITALSNTITAMQATLQSLAANPQGRLTLTSATPILSTGVTAGTAVYYTPFIGNLVPIYDGSQINSQIFTELTLTLNSNHVASTIYDVFVFMNSGAVTLGTGPAWNTSTANLGARGTGAGTTDLNRTVGGFLTNANAMTARNGATTYSVNVNCGTYVGSILIDGTNGQISCLPAYGQSRKWGVWNAFNRAPIMLKAGDPTSNWTYGTNTIRPSNNNAANAITIFTGLAEEYFDLKALQQMNLTANTGAQARCGIGYNSTNSFSGTSVGGGQASSGGITFNFTTSSAFYIAPPALGQNVITMNETPGEATSKTFFGAESLMLLSAQYRG